MDEVIQILEDNKEKREKRQKRKMEKKKIASRKKSKILNEKIILSPLFTQSQIVNAVFTVCFKESILVDVFASNPSSTQTGFPIMVNAFSGTGGVEETNTWLLSDEKVDEDGLLAGIHEVGFLKLSVGQFGPVRRSNGRVGGGICAVISKMKM